MPETFMKSIYDGYTAKEAGNLKEAFECFAKASVLEPGSPIAAYEIAWYYELGEVVAKDLERAFQLYSQAADGCVEKAQLKLADWYEQGIHVKKDAGMAKHWRKRASEAQKKDKEPPMTIAESIRQKIAESQANKKH